MDEGTFLRRRPPIMSGTSAMSAMSTCPCPIQGAQEYGDGKRGAQIRASAHERWAKGSRRTRNSKLSICAGVFSHFEGRRQAPEPTVSCKHESGSARRECQCAEGPQDLGHLGVLPPIGTLIIPKVRLKAPAPQTTEQLAQQCQMM